MNLMDWIRANPADTIDLTVEDLAPKRGDANRLDTERERLQRNAEFYSGEQLRYENVARLAASSAAECEALAESYRLALGELESRTAPDAAHEALQRAIGVVKSVTADVGETGEAPRR